MARDNVRTHLLRRLFCEFCKHFLVLWTVSLADPRTSDKSSATEDKPYTNITIRGSLGALTASKLNQSVCIVGKWGHFLQIKPAAAWLIQDRVVSLHTQAFQQWRYQGYKVWSMHVARLSGLRLFSSQCTHFDCEPAVFGVCSRTTIQLSIIVMIK